MHINLEIEKPVLFPSNPCTVRCNSWQCFPEQYFVQHDCWYGVISIEMQETKVHEFWENGILIENLVPISGADCPPNE